MTAMYNNEQERISLLKHICEDFDRSDAYEWEVLCGKYVMNDSTCNMPLGVTESGIWEDYEKVRVTEERYYK